MSTSLKKMCYRSSRLWRGRGAAQFRRDEVLPSVGILRGGILAPVFTAPVSPQRNVSLILVDLFHVDR